LEYVHILKFASVSHTRDTQGLKGISQNMLSVPPLDGHLSHERSGVAFSVCGSMSLLSLAGVWLGGGALAWLSRVLGLTPRNTHTCKI
jgi:hypothetical protein